MVRDISRVFSILFFLFLFFWAVTVFIYSGCIFLFSMGMLWWQQEWVDRQGCSSCQLLVSLLTVWTPILQVITTYCIVALSHLLNCGNCGRVMMLTHVHLRTVLRQVLDIYIRWYMKNMFPHRSSLIMQLAHLHSGILCMSTCSTAWLNKNKRKWKQNLQDEHSVRLWLKSNKGWI